MFIISFIIILAEKYWFFFNQNTIKTCWNVLQISVKNATFLTVTVLGGYLTLDQRFNCKNEVRSLPTLFLRGVIDFRPQCTPFFWKFYTKMHTIFHVFSTIFNDPKNDALTMSIPFLFFTTLTSFASLFLMMIMMISNHSRIFFITQ